ncbi:MAG: CotH kinase family protein [Crocinitomicaceae bacterium]|nr:CotH kinase family protein [Crocinitomicaceae bacterium]
MKKLLFILTVCWSNIVFGQNPVEPPKGIPEIRLITELEIVNDLKVTAEIKISDYPRSEIWRNCGIELRGNSTLLAEKKSYDFEFRTRLGEELTETIFGFPPEEDFVLLANSYDKSFSRNALAFEMWDALGHYTPKYVYCNLYLNDEFQGLYMLAEKIKVDEWRVQVMDPKKSMEQPIHNGFMVKMDWDASDYSMGYEHGSIGKRVLNYDFVYPKRKKLKWKIRYEAQEQLSLMGHAFEELLHLDSVGRSYKHYSEVVDINSFVDYFLVNELCKNPDGLKTSMYLYRYSNYLNDSVLPKIFIGPIWDMDLGLANVEY